MCGILAALLADEGGHCVGDLVDGMTVLQHRGQDAAGFTTASTSQDWEKVTFKTVKGTGMVREVFAEPSKAQELLGNVGIAHVRYPTAGGSGLDDVQPFYANFPCGLALAHNGNLTNSEKLRKELVSRHRHLNTTSDSEALLNVFAEHLAANLEARRKGSVGHAGEPLSTPVSPETLFDAVERTMRRCVGGYAVVILVHNVGVIAFRDPWGIRPIVFGERPSRTKAGDWDRAASSESVALDTLGYTLCRDVAPGEAVLLRPGFPVLTQRCAERALHRPCIFEYVYFARPDSIMDGVSVYAAQLKMGEKLAAKIKRTIGSRPFPDVVIAVPDTSRPIALQCAYSLDSVYREGFIKNRYIGRTFIMPGQEERRKGVRMKLNTIKSEFAGRTVLLIDDSIVRGTTSRELVLMAREAGAKNVYFVSASPEVRHPNVYGINISTHNELIAHGRTADEVATFIKADWVLFQDLVDLEACVRELNPTLTEFENSVFSGCYVTEEDDDLSVGTTSSKGSPRHPASRVSPEFA